MINVWIDEMTPCLKDSVTGEYVPTEVIRIVRRSFLNKLTVPTAGILIGRICWMIAKYMPWSLRER